ncbi:intersectin-1 isoform X2 [Thrips palmi]|uniref:Intersectin-1 isoform X2 n=1 Tax=Thrips palmi TaxID=161013 RepID=A0A6P8ZA03_THRPL|nr:intersectin-1 isoform X2 [Thrips palmi]
MAGVPGGMEAWVVQPRERARYAEQFMSLNPINGIVTGDQAKGFLLQSQLPPAVLGQIWGLADTDADGKMNINEFSIACKLINLKLRGFEIPKVLPPILLQSLTQAVAPAAAPVSAPMQAPMAAPIAAVTAPPIPPLPNMGTLPRMPAAPAQPGVMPMQPGVMPVQPAVMPIQAGAVPITTQPMSMSAPVPQAGVPLMMPGTVPQTAMPMVPGVLPAAVPGAMPQAMPAMPAAPAGMIPGVVPSAPGMTPMPGVTPVSGVTPVAPLDLNKPMAPSLTGTPTSAPGSATGSYSGERMGSVDLGFGYPHIEWAVPHQSKLKYTQLFNTTDRARSGFLSGPQARNIMVSTGVPQRVLASIWGLADMDSDGRLSCEEFVLALHLCDMAKAGEKIPAALPLDLIPPSFRRQRQGSVPGSGAVVTPGSDKGVELDAAATLISQVTFEDKRKENFEKGQAELDRRRKSLLEIQRKEQEERERKEREEQEKREKIRLEQERRRQEEMERQLQRQREMEQEKEEQRKAQLEQREAARREMERQRQQEWEKQRSQELQQARQKEQEKVLSLKAHNQKLGIDLSQLNEKVKELTTKISETRMNVSSVKTTIDGMRGTRDTQMSEMQALKHKLKDQNNRLLLLSQEKARIESKNKMNQAQDEDNKEALAQAASAKQIALKQMRDRIADLEKEVEAKMEDMENNNTQLTDLKNELSKLVDECETLYNTFDDRRSKVLQIKSKMKKVDPLDANAAWGNSSWDSAPSWNDDSSTAADAAVPAQSGLCRYRALYEFVARNQDEISFQPGDIIMVPHTQNGEPGWLAGEIRGHTGWFPESYVEPIDTPAESAEAIDAAATSARLEGIAEVPENVSDAGSAADPALAAAQVPPAADGQEWYMSMYPYESGEPGDLSFGQGEMMLVVKKDGDWWTGVIGDRTGIFPSNYVQKTDSTAGTATSVPAAAATTHPAVSDISEEVMAAMSKTAAEVQSLPQHEKPATPDFAALNQSTLGSKGKKPEIATVLAPYKATSTEQLSLNRGQLIMVRKKTDTGWWEGELQAKGKKRQVGWFPASYVKLVQKKSGQDTPPATTVTSAAASPSPSPTPMCRDGGAGLEKVIALYQYVAQNEDELSFEKDDTITILAKEEAAWWRGELNGVSGLFPSNYVAPLSMNLLSGVERKRQDSIAELIGTEQAYIDDMSIVHEVFENPLMQRGILSKEQLQKVFVNWKEIIVCNVMFLRALRVRRDMSSGGVIRMIGDILCENLPKMKVYVRFCSCQLTAASTLQDLQENSEDFREVSRLCQRDPRTKGLPLSSFLIKPMQRITKYPLLIKKILHYTSIDHPDHSYVQEALSKAEELCNQVNEGVREKENSDRLEWLQRNVQCDGLNEQIDFNSLTNSLGPRKFLHHGVLIKAKSGKELMGFLLTDFLMLAKPSKSLTGKQFSFEKNMSVSFKLYKKPLILSDIQVADNSGKISPTEPPVDATERRELKLELIDAGTNLVLLAPSTTERNLWFKKLDLAKRQFMEHEQSHLRRQQSKQAQFGAVGRILAVVMNGLNLNSSGVRQLPPKGTLLISVLHGDEMALVRPSGKCEAFCKVTMGSQEHRTAVANGPAPQWNASMQFLVKDLQEDRLCITVFDRGHFTPDEFLGRTEVRVSEILKSSSETPGPISKRLILHEVETGEVEVKLDLRLFSKEQ